MDRSFDILHFAFLSFQSSVVTRVNVAFGVALVSMLMCHPVLAQSSPQSVTDLVAKDHPNDVGTTLDVSWSLSPDDDPDADPPAVSTYHILRKREGDAEFTKVGEVPLQSTSFTDKNVERKQAYLYQVVAVGPGGESAAVTTTEAATPVMEWFRTDRGWLAVFVLLICTAVTTFIVIAKSGRELYIRNIPGLEAVDEAVGRATEMGRACLFVPGIQDINDIQTVAGITVLSRVASLTAEYGARLEVPTARSLVMTTARETVEASYLAEGRPDAYRKDDIYYLTDEQFGYAAAVTGTITREKPAACFYMGTFYAESLLLAETANGVGAIQVAGTAEPAQLPFFVAACDYTLIGEEFFAASAYLSGEPIQLGSLRGQDVGKLLVAALVLIGCGVATWGSVAANTELVGGEMAASLMSFLQDNVLGSKGFLP
ncbi:MAG: fibronectin type III domain-containing protein [Planctomycetaceae bacterium]|nr:fibronectin type III domain-containing protein [Planctomycetaceae bacterium]